MFKFYKENSYQIVRCMINQLGITIFALIISTVTQRNDKLLLVGSICATVFYLFLLYTMMWEQGAKDILRVEGGRASLDRLYGFKVAACANLPNLLLAGLTLIGFIFGDPLLHLDFAWADGLYGIASLIISLIEAMYIGILKAVIPSGTYQYLVGTVAYILTSAPAILVCGFSYLLGVKNIRLFFFDPTSRKKQK